MNEDNKLKNFPTVVDGKTYWISRSVAVVGFVFARVNKQLCILANKRGEGTPDFQGKWNVPCGYLDYDETGEEGCVREIFEETGVKLNPTDMKFIQVNTDPVNSNRQNVSLRYRTYLSEEFAKNITFTNKNSESNEVDDIKWIPIRDIDNYEWAFNHNELIKNMMYL
jgi:8-oxo-dGTP pyrophosphatase MutT (NUDIX family)